MASSSYDGTLPAVSLPVTTASAPVPRSQARWWNVWAVEPAVVLAVGGRCVGIVAGLVGSIVSARYLQPAGRGEYFLALTMAQLVAQFGNVGLQSGNTYFVARDRSLFSGLLANSIWISFLGVPVMGAMVLIATLWGGVGAMTSTAAWFAVALAPLFVFNLLGNGLFVGLNQMKTFSLIQPLSTTIVLPLIVFAAMLGSGPAGFLAASVAGWTLTIAVMLALLFRQSDGSARFRSDIFWTTCSYSTKAYLATLAGFVVLRMNVFILHASAGAEQVGYYSVASQIADTLSILPQSMATVLFPRLVAAGRGRFGTTMREAGRAAVILCAVCAVVWVAASPAIHVAFGSRFAPAVPVVRAMLPAVFLLGVMSVVSQYLAASGFPASVVWCWLGAVALSAAVGPGLTARAGAVGASEALALTYAVLLVALLVLCWRTRGEDADGGRNADFK